MIELDKKIREQYYKSSQLKKISVGDDKMSFEKSRKLQKQQDKEWDKLMFLKNLKKEMQKNARD